MVLKTLKKYLPDTKGMILDGGCGRGQIVYCMHVHGYRAIGVDLAEETIRGLPAELDVRVGDVRNLEFPDSYFVGYWSMGVVEHSWDGYHDVLNEMRRVLVDGGYVFLAFPYMSPLRRLKARLGFYEEYHIGEENSDFYQFALDKKTVIKDFEQYGFQLVSSQPLDGPKGTKDEIAGWARTLLRKVYNYDGRNSLIKGFMYMLDKLLVGLGAGHVMFLVFRKKN